jgi:L-asparaginase II
MGNFEPLVEVVRGGWVESVHHGAIAVADRKGQVIASCGDPESVPFLRSSAKPFQAIPVVEALGNKLSDRQVAIICASHSGSSVHTEAVQSLLDTVGLKLEQLQCGVHPPLDKDTAKHMESSNAEPSCLHHNCSGKHSGMLALAQHLNSDLSTYLDFGHPVQVRMLVAVAELCLLNREQIVLAIDGCSAPNHALPLRNLAAGIARLMDPVDLPPARAGACRRIRDCMRAHPNLVGGPGRFDTRLMQLTQGLLLSKAGAEGVFAIGLHSKRHAGAIGIALKIADGDIARRAGALVSITVLEQLGVLPRDVRVSLRGLAPTEVLNFRQIEVGQIRAVFQLEGQA